MAQMPFAKRRKLLTSRAYHVTRDRAIRAGTDREKATEMGREAAGQVAAKLDAEKAALEVRAEDDGA